MIKQCIVRNKLLSSLSTQDFRLLAPLLEPVELRRDFVLIEPNKPIKHVFFVDCGVASVTSKVQNGRIIELGIYGREGMSGIAVLLASDRTPCHHSMQVSGSGFRVGTIDLLHHVEQSTTLRNVLLRFIHVFMTQTAQNAFVNGSFLLEQRLARWMLMCHDRIDTNQFPCAHNLLSSVLGKSRSRVTHAIHHLEGAGLIRAKRGRITIHDRAGMERIAGAAYGLPEAEYRRLIGLM